MQQDLAAVAALHEELAQETQEQRLQLLGQVWQAQQYLGQQDSVCCAACQDAQQILS
jgi:hypothetical protein